MVKPVGFVLQISFGHVPKFFSNIFSFRQILKQNSDLINENLVLQSSLAKLQDVSYENEILKKELNFSQAQGQSTHLIASAIIGRANGSTQTITIDKGQNSGLRQGQAVVSQGFLIGTVANVRADNSDVILITDYNSLIPVVFASSRGTGLLRGGLDGLVVEDLPLNITPAPGEAVVTSGLGGEIPGGLAIGKFQAVVSHPGDIFQKATISSPIDFSGLEVLFVVPKWPKEVNL